jgi:hypothetical protein
MKLVPLKPDRGHLRVGEGHAAWIEEGKNFNDSPLPTLSPSMSQRLEAVFHLSGCRIAA